METKNEAKWFNETPYKEVIDKLMKEDGLTFQQASNAAWLVFNVEDRMGA